MILIAHRGNLIGPRKELENNPAYIDTAISKNYNVEIDLRAVGSNLYLGHDHADHAISIQYLLDRQTYLWVHCKDHVALDLALQANLHCFWHDKDDYTLTSQGYVWAYPGKLQTQHNCIVVMPEQIWPTEVVRSFTCYGICSDYVEFLRTD